MGARLFADNVRKHFALPAADVVVHFRCASMEDMGLLPESYFRKSLQHVAKGASIVVVTNSHSVGIQDNIQVRACARLRDMLARRLRSMVRDASVQTVDVATDAPSASTRSAAAIAAASAAAAKRDLLTMMIAPTFIGTTSSFSLLAARLQLEPRSFMPKPYLNISKVCSSALVQLRERSVGPCPVGSVRVRLGQPAALVGGPVGLFCTCTCTSGLWVSVGTPLAQNSTAQQ